MTRTLFWALTVSALLWPMIGEASHGAPSTSSPHLGPDLEEKRDKKLAEPWLSENDWVLSYKEAREKSRETGKPIFAYFTRSYAP